MISEISLVQAQRIRVAFQRLERRFMATLETSDGWLARAHAYCQVALAESRPCSCLDELSRQSEFRTDSFELLPKFRILLPFLAQIRVLDSHVCV